MEKKVVRAGAGADVMVDLGDVQLSSDTTPNGIISLVEVSNDVLSKINDAVV